MVQAYQEQGRKNMSGRITRRPQRRKLEGGETEVAEAIDEGRKNMLGEECYAMGPLGRRRKTEEEASWGR